MNYGGGQTPYISDLEGFARQKGWLTEKVAHGNVKAPVYEERSSPKSTQVGGSHYSKMAIQPFDFVMANGLDYAQGTAIYYIARCWEKNGIEDLEKAIHTLQLYIEHKQHGSAEQCR